MRRIAVLIFSIVVLSARAEAKVYVAEPYLVDPASYSGAEFYVYRPYNMPSDWFVTFDGYAVTKTKDNVWVYGAIQGGTPVPTNYIVGSVNPSLAGIIPYYGPGEISSFIKMPPAIAKQPLGMAPNQVARQIYLPQWAVNPSFIAIGNWRGSVDRIGILSPLNAPIAWKGDYPKVIFVWLGDKWHQVNRSESQEFSQALKLNLYSLTKSKTKSQFRWYPEDTVLLTDRTVNWGYYWMGDITVR